MPTIICPYLHDTDITELYGQCCQYPCIFEKDLALIGSDLMYEKLWNQATGDIIILHSDMKIVDPNWYTKLVNYAKQYPEAGLIGCKLLYPAKNEQGLFYLQSAGGRFTDSGNPDHYGSGIELNSRTVFKDPEVDNGQYDYVREVAWTTFGGVYIRREVLNQVGDFDREYEWTYNRDVDYCLKARELGWKIYQVPVTLLHYESKDNKKLRSPEKVAQESRNLLKLKNKWQNTEWYKTMDKKVI